MPEVLDGPTWLFVLPWMLRSGAGVDQVVLNLMANVRADGRAVPLLLVSDWDSPRPHRESPEGLPAVRLRLVAPLAGPARTVDRLIHPFRMAAQSIRLWTLLRRERVRVVNVHYVGTFAWTFLLLRRLGLYRGRVVLSWHGADLQAARDAPAAERGALAWLARGADANVACSSALMQTLRQVFPDARGLDVVRNGIGLATLAAIDVSSPPDGAVGRPYVLSIAAFEHKKGLDVLIDAFARLAPSHPALDLAVVGGSGPERAALEARAQALGLAPRVRFLTDLPHAEAMRHLAHARAFVLASRREPFGIVLLEAGFFGIPVVASDVDGIPETIESGISGELVPPGDAEALARALDGVLSDEARARRLGQTLRAQVMAGADWRSRFERYARILDPR